MKGYDIDLSPLAVGTLAVVDLLGQAQVDQKKAVADLQVAQNEVQSLRSQIDSYKAQERHSDALVTQLRTDLQAATGAAVSAAPVIEKAKTMLNALAHICETTPDVAAPELMAKGLRDVIEALS